MDSSPHYNHGLLWRAIAISLLLHALLLLQPGLEPISFQSAGDRSLFALLRPMAIDSANGPNASPVSSAVRSSTKSHKMISSASPASEASTESVTPDSTSAQDVTSGIVLTAKSQGEEGIPASAVKGDVDLEFSEDRKAYLFAIAAEARRVKKYPPRAFAAGWSGTAEIKVTVVAGGVVQAPRLSKSSGYAEIDNAALAFVGAAIKRTQMPEALRRRSFDFVVPVSFTIDER